MRRAEDFWAPVTGIVFLYVARRLSNSASDASIQVRRPAIIALIRTDDIRQRFDISCFCRVNDFADFRPPRPWPTFPERWLLFRLSGLRLN